MMPEQPGFDPPDNPIDPAIWKPNASLINLALKRCGWVNCDQINELEGEEWLRTIVVSAYYQGLADGVKHMARKQRKVQDLEARHAD
jgi:hypothetical protein